MGSGIRLSNTVGNEAGALGVPTAAGAPQSPATPGAEGPFSVQVSSFRSQTGAQAFAQRLRERGYHAFVAAPATAPNGVVWHRVRIGPFATQREATTYRAQFENRERMPTIVVRRDAPGNERD
jgi:cell division septation protein DedD